MLVTPPSILYISLIVNNSRGPLIVEQDLAEYGNQAYTIENRIRRTGNNDVMASTVQRTPGEIIST